MLEALKPYLKQRLVQVASRYIAFLVLATGWNSAKAEQYTDMTVELAVGAALIAVDHIASRIRRKAIADGEIEVK